MWLAFFITISCLILTGHFSYSSSSKPWPDVPNDVKYGENFAERDTNGSITKIYLVSSCHLDLGFANTLVDIVNEYFDKYFPNAIATAKELKQHSGEERLVFTTHSYLIWLYLNCPISSGLHCPDKDSVKEFTKAIEDGDIVWHAYPFNAQPEVYDKLMAEFGIQFTQDLSKNVTKGKFFPNTMSQRDVPGLTRSMIPLLNKHGIKAITVGVNEASMPPAVPSAFKWIDQTSNTHVLAMWHPRGYGGMNGVGPESMVIVKGMKSALAFAIRVDNSGPPSAIEVFNNFGDLKFLFPHAKIIASGYNEFVEELSNHSHLLQEYTEEIGDTWIHGVASDPWKTVQYKEILRMRSDCLMSNECSLSDQRFYNFSSFLLKYGEHTWGEDVKTYLDDFENWENSQFQPLMYTDDSYIEITNSWIEQRRWAIDYALEALEDHPLGERIKKNLQNLYYEGQFPSSDANYKRIYCDDFTYGNITFQLDQSVMGINNIIDSRGSEELNFGGHDYGAFGRLVYSAYNETDYKYFLDNYLEENASFALKDIGKPGIKSHDVTTSPSAQFCWEKIDEKKDVYSFLVEGFFKDKVVTEYGAPKVVWLEVSLHKVTNLEKEVPINMTLYLVDKTPARIPESLSFYFRPNTKIVDPSTMSVSKLGQLINVYDVVKNGSKHVHSTDEGIVYNGSVPLRAKAWDTNVVSIGGVNVFPVPMETPDADKGFAFNIYNNLWGTNYIMWYPYRPADQSSKYRFTVTLPPKTN